MMGCVGNLKDYVVVIGVSIVGLCVVWVFLDFYFMVMVFECDELLEVLVNWVMVF